MTSKFFSNKNSFDAIQAFLHYVNADGPHKDFLYDKRPYLGMPSN